MYLYQTKWDRIYCNVTMPKKFTHEQFVEKANKKHNNEFEYLSEYKNLLVLMSIKHKPCGHIYNQMPQTHLGKTGRCPVCYGHKITNEEFLKRAKQVHGDEYLYLDEYSLINIKIRMIHNICGHEFKQTPADHIGKKSGCPRCSINGAKICSHEKFVEKANKKHNNQFEYISKYIGCRSPIDIIHKPCGKKLQQCR